MSESEQGSEITRRQALKRGALVAGTTMWVAPVVQALAMSHASAERPSGAPARGRGTGIEQSGGKANENAGG